MRAGSRGSCACTACSSRRGTSVCLSPALSEAAVDGEEHKAVVNNRFTVALEAEGKCSKGDLHKLGTHGECSTSLPQ